MSIKLEEVWKAYYDFTGRLSGICRQLNFAGLAIIWLFVKREDDGIIYINPFLKYALFMFVLSFVIDLTQYVYFVQLHYTTVRRMEKNKERLTGYDPIHVSIGHGVFLSKALFTLLAYLWVGGFLGARLYNQGLNSAENQEYSSSREIKRMEELSNKQKIFSQEKGKDI